MTLHASLRRVFGSLWLAFMLLGSGCVPKLGFAPTPEPVVLRFAYRQRAMDLKPLLQEFQSQNPYITIQIVEAQAYGNSLDTTIKNNKIDVFRTGRDGLAYASQGLILPLDDLQVERWNDVRKEYYKGTWEGLAIKGTQWGIPAGLDKMVVFINNDKLKALNLTLPKPNWTLFNFLDLANKMNFPQGTGDQPENLFGFCTDPTGMDSILFVYLHGGKIVDNLDNPTRAMLDDPATIEAVQWYTELFGRQQVAPDPELVKQQFTRGGIYEAAMRGMCGMWLGWYSERAGRGAYGSNVNYKMLPLPKDRADFGLGDLDGYYITKNCAHPNEALKFIRYLSDHWESSGGKIPPRRDLAEGETYVKAVGAEAATIAKTAEQVVIIPYMAGDGSSVLERVGGQYMQALQIIITENLQASKILSQAQDATKAYFKAP
jgi:ABC-type glycerol-3-phosphate transport system substrate-binding protein